MNIYEYAKFFMIGFSITFIFATIAWYHLMKKIGDDEDTW